MKIYIDGIEVLCDKDITITEEMLSTSSVILNNVFPKAWDTQKDYVSNFYFPKDYSKCLIKDSEDNLIFAGVVKNTGNISLNPREPHYASLQVLDFKTFLSESTTLDFVINDKTVLEAITTVINKMSNYGFIVGNIQIANPSDKIGTYNTQNQTAYDVLQYLSEISGARWFTRMVDENQVAVDFYDPTLMPSGTELEYTNEFFENNKIIDMNYNYSSSDYRNKQVILSDDVYADIEYTDTRYSDGYTLQFNTMQKIGKVVSLTVDGSEVAVATTEDKELGITADFYYKVNDTLFESANQLAVGSMIVITYIPLIEGRQIVYNSDEVDRIANQTNRNGVIARYETRNDVLSSNELRKVAQSYIDFKSSAEITLTIQTEDANLWNIGEVVLWQDAPLDELKKSYMVKKKVIQRIVVNSLEKIFYTFELTSSFNSEEAINYFDNQRRKATGNIQAGEFIERNIDIENSAKIIFDNLEETDITILSPNALNCVLDAELVL